MTAAQARKAIAVAALAVAELAAYIIADPTDLPPWVVAAAGLVNVLAVYYIRNAQPKQGAADEVFGPRRNPPSE
jgi:hypothetical protein